MQRGCKNRLCERGCAVFARRCVAEPRSQPRRRRVARILHLAHADPTDRRVVSAVGRATRGQWTQWFWLFLGVLAPVGRLAQSAEETA